MYKAKVVKEENVLATAVKTVLKAMLVAAAALMLLTLFIAFGNISDATASACVEAASFISVFSAGFMTARKRNKSGWLAGLMAGAVYVLLMLLIGFVILGSFAVTGDTVKMFFISVLGSIVGGIVGVNFKKKRK